jgi:hypothetical protein
VFAIGVGLTEQATHDLKSVVLKPEEYAFHTSPETIHQLDKAVEGIVAVLCERMYNMSRHNIMYLSVVCEGAYVYACMRV